MAYPGRGEGDIIFARRGRGMSFRSKYKVLSNLLKYIYLANKVNKCTYCPPMPSFIEQQKL